MQSGVRRLQNSQRAKYKSSAASQLNKVAKVFDKGLDKASELTGVKTAVRLAGGLAEDTSAVLRGKKAPRRFTPKTGKALAGDLVDLATFGGITTGALKLGAKAAVKQAVKPAIKGVGRQSLIREKVLLNSGRRAIRGLDAATEAVNKTLGAATRRGSAKMIAPILLRGIKKRKARRK